jgi:hypothetical protein
VRRVRAGADEQPRPARFVGALVAGAVLLAGAAVRAQQPDAASLAPAPPARFDLPFPIDDPAPPAPPAVIARDESGRATIRAVRLDAPLRIDGRLDEAVYREIPPLTDFVQIEPREGSPATEQTEAWLTFDRDHVYVSFRCWDSRMDRAVANEMRRDSSNIWSGNDLVGFVFDTFYDRRNGVLFTVTPVGGRQDGQVTNERQWNGDWNPVWDVDVEQFDRGWTVEAAIPFKSLRYRPARSQVWGFNVLRVVRSKNEMSFLRPLPAARGQIGLQQVSLAATVVGIEAPPGSKNLEVKPYATASLTTDERVRPALVNDPDGTAGLDVKYGVTENLTADFTYNTDFAQVEADEQQVNLTRFRLLFPEKREFFLEGLGTYSFGGAAPSGSNTGDTPILFYSRRIGLNENLVVPLVAGGRLGGRAGAFSIGLLDVQAGEDATAGAPGTNFSVVRLKRDVLRRSSVGMMATRRSAGELGGPGNTAYGVDGAFAFYDNLTINTYWARAQTDGLAAGDSYRAQLSYDGDRYGVQAERLVVDATFDPGVGFVRRPDMRKSFALFRFSPRPRSIASVRKFSWGAAVNYIENGTGRLESRNLDGEFGIEFQSSDRFAVAVNDSYEFLPRPFEIAPGVVLPVGGYDFGGVRVGFNAGPQRQVSANLAAEYGTFYRGRRAAFSATRGRVNLSPRFSLEPTCSINLVDLPEGAFTTTLAGSRVTYTMTPRMFVSTLLQYNSTTDAVAANVRLRWEYRPGSELFIVYNDERSALEPGAPRLANRSLVVKINRLFRL